MQLVTGVQRHAWRWTWPLGLATLGVLFLLTMLRSLPVALAAAPTTGETCFATPNNGTTVYSSTTAQAVREAVGAAAPNSVVKMAGYCPGVQAQDGSTQTVLITQTLTLAGGYTTTNWITPNVTANPTTLDAQGGGRVISTTSAAVGITLQGFTVTNGYFNAGIFNRHGGGLYAASQVTLTDMTFYSNTVIASTGAPYGGGAYITGSVTISQTTFKNNSAGVNGGGLYVGGPANVTNTTFVSNQTPSNPMWATSGGGAYFNSTAQITGTIFMSNTAKQSGSGAYFAGPANLWDTAFTGNGTPNFGGGAYFAGAAQITTSSFTNNTTSSRGAGAMVMGAAQVTGTTFTNNRGPGGMGGGLSVFGTANITHTTFVSNIAQFGGGLSVLGTANVVGLTFTNNTAVLQNGGGAYFGSAVYVINTTFTSNTATTEGGGVYFFGPATLTGTTFISNRALLEGGGVYFNSLATVTGTTFSGNTALNGGGAYLATATAKQLVNVLLARNQASGNGAAIYVANANPLQLIHTTIVSPTAPTSGTQALYVVTGTVQLTNTLIASHTVGIGNEGGTVNEWHGLYADVTTPYTGSVTASGSITGPAAFYDPTAYTLTAASWAVEAGAHTSSNRDFFGNLRPQGHLPDVGYAESPFVSPLTFALTAQPAHLFANGLDEAVVTVTATLANSLPWGRQPVTLTASPLGTFANTLLMLSANGVATTTYTVGVQPGPAPLTVTINDLGTPKIATTTVTLKPNPLVGTFNAAFAGQVLTYTFVVTNVDALTQTVILSGSAPSGASLIAVTGGITVATGGDYGFGYAEASNIVLAPNASYTLQWTIQFIGFTGDVDNQAHAESTTARLRLPALLRIYRQLLMPVYRP